MDLILPCQFEVTGDIKIECSNAFGDLSREFGSIEASHNFSIKENVYFASPSQNRLFCLPCPDPYEHRNASGSARALGIKALSWTMEKPINNLDRCIQMPQGNSPIFTQLLHDNLKNKTLEHKVSFFGSDADINFIKEKLEKERKKKDPNRAYIEECEMFLHNIFEFRKCPSFKKGMIYFKLLGLNMAPVAYLNKQSKSPDKEGLDSQWGSFVACGKNDEFSWEQEVRTEIYLSAPYGERCDIYLLSPLIKHLQIHCPGISKLCLARIV